MIYCVEDDSSIRELMVYTLQASGFEACGFQDAAAFWNMMKEKKPELVILDIMLPGEDGISILKKLRTSPVTEEIPVIMATAKDSEYDTVIGLDSGADDYLSKPFGMMEMVSRIKAVLRRSTPKKKQKQIQCGSSCVAIEDAGRRFPGVMTFSLYLLVFLLVCLAAFFNLIHFICGFHLFKQIVCDVHRGCIIFRKKAVSRKESHIACRH